ncbi:hypothetical protein C8R47DRAFT_1123026 [Mycena vitilis]|nr:hypothetical protein C8R47DRAFT_1123026 [Mycena vitilis]
MSLLNPIIQVFNYTLQPIAPFMVQPKFNLSISTLDVVAAFRLCIVLRQNGAHTVAPRAFGRDVASALTVVYGGEIMTAPLLCIPPSFMVSGVIPVFYTVVQAIVEMLPAVPTMSIHTELPLSVVDGFTRAILLCNLIPPAVTTNSSPLIAASPWTLLVSSLVTANGVFFLTNLLSFLNPYFCREILPAEEERRFEFLGEYIVDISPEAPWIWNVLPVKIQESILKQYDMALMTSPRCPTQFIGDHIMGSLVWSFYDQGDFVPIVRLMPYFEANCYCTVALDSTVQRGASGLNSEPLNATAISSIPHFLQLTCFDRFRAASVLAARLMLPPHYFLNCFLIYILRFGTCILSTQL